MTGRQAYLPHPGCRARKLAKEEPLSLFQEFVRHIEEGEEMRLSATDAFAISDIALHAGIC